MKSVIEQLKSGIHTTSAVQTEAIATEFGRQLPVDSILAFHGDLGAGKTTFIRGLARAWEIREPVTSPTFNLYSIYNGTRQLVHLDAYRLNDGSDLDALMIEDFLESPWCLAIEWPERISESLPDNIWHLYLNIDANEAHTIRLELK